MKCRVLAISTAVVVSMGLSATAAQATNIKLQSTTDINDSGIYNGVMVPGYVAAQPGDTITPTFVGTGAALTNARNGLGDVVVTHALSLEHDFVNDGYSDEPLGRAVFFNDYVVVGPKTDPAGVTSGASATDAVKAYAKIAAWGATNSTATFVSRNDASGTNVQEQILWGLVRNNISSPPATIKSCNDTPADTVRFQPGTACDASVPRNPALDTIPAWYRYTPVTGQGANLTTTNNCSTFSGRSGCYTMLDRGTWIQNAAVSTNLKIVSAGQSSGAIGGPDLQENPFHAYIVTDTGKTYPNGYHPQMAAAKRFVDYLQSASAQAAITAWNGSQAMQGDATPILDQNDPPSCTRSGGNITLTATFDYAPPPTPTIMGGVAVTLDSSTNGGATWTGAVTHNAGSSTGRVSWTFPFTATAPATQFRMTTAQYDDTANFSRFAPIVPITTDAWDPNPC